MYGRVLELKCAQSDLEIPIKNLFNEDIHWSKKNKITTSQLLTSSQSRIQTLSNDRTLYTKYHKYFCSQIFLHETFPSGQRERHPVISRFHCYFHHFTLVNYESFLIDSSNPQIKSPNL